MAMGCSFDLLAGGFLNLTPHQMLVGGTITFFTHILGTGFPVMVFIYAILFPRYLKLTGSPASTVLLGGLSYAVLHIFEYWTLYDSVSHGLLSVLVVVLTFGPPGADEVLSHGAHCQRLGTLVGLPRHHAARNRRYTDDRGHLPHSPVIFDG